MSWSAYRQYYKWGIKMHDIENVTVFDQEECDILHDALRAYICHLDMIKASCRNPVMIDGIPIEARIAKVRSLKNIVYGRTSKARKEHENKVG